MRPRVEHADASDRRGRLGAGGHAHKGAGEAVVRQLVDHLSGVDARIPDGDLGPYEDERIRVEGEVRGAQRGRVGAVVVVERAADDAGDAHVRRRARVDDGRAHRVRTESPGHLNRPRAGGHGEVERRSARTDDATVGPNHREGRLERVGRHLELQPRGHRPGQDEAIGLIGREAVPDGELGVDGLPDHERGRRLGAGVDEGQRGRRAFVAGHFDAPRPGVERHATIERGVRIDVGFEGRGTIVGDDTDAYGRSSVHDDAEPDAGVRREFA